MVGTPTMSLYGWKQLALWSIEHSCLAEHEKASAKTIWKKKWEAFCTWIVEDFKPRSYEVDEKVEQSDGQGFEANVEDHGGNLVKLVVCFP